jgi:polygalacturonase
MIVSSTSQLIAALKAGASVIALAQGDYSGVVISGYHGQVTISSADPAHRAVIHDLTIDHSSGVTLRGLDLSTAGQPVAKWGAAATKVFYVLNSEKILLDDLTVHGDPNGSLATDISGLQIRDSNHVTLTNSDFQHLHWAVEDIDDTYLTVSGNHFHNNRDDGLRGGGAANVLVENNRCDSNHPDEKDDDHPDCIQFWTEPNVHSHDITIVGNVYRRGQGLPTQGIFFRDQHENLPFEKVVIKNNTIEGAGYNGISITGAIDPILEGNVVCEYNDQHSWITLRNVKMAHLNNNKASLFKYVESSDIHADGSRPAKPCHK